MAQIEGYNTFKVVGYPENFAVASKAAQNDYVLFNDPMVLIQSIYTDAGGAETFLAAAITVASIDEADTTITYSAGSGIPRLQGDYLLKVDQELIHVKADTDETADTGTLTVVRAAFGTEAAELMEIMAGTMKILLPNQTEWQEVKGGESFNVPANSSFKLVVTEVADYCCSYLK